MPVHNKGGAKGAEAFASKFAGGDPIRLLAFKVQTSIRTRKGDPLTAADLAFKFKVSDEEMDNALMYLIGENKINRVEQGDKIVFTSVTKRADNIEDLLS